MSEYVATAVCYFGLGLSAGLMVSSYWLHTEHAEWKRIVDHLHHIIERHLVYRELEQGGGLDVDEFINHVAQQECEDRDVG